MNGRQECSKLTETERLAVENFSCRSAQCFVPWDRAVVLDEIRREWGSTDAFDEYVRTHLAEVIGHGKSDYYDNPWRAVVQAIALLFGN